MAARDLPLAPVLLHEQHGAPVRDGGHGEPHDVAERLVQRHRPGEHRARAVEQLERHVVRGCRARDRRCAAVAHGRTVAHGAIMPERRGSRQSCRGRRRRGFRACLEVLVPPPGRAAVLLVRDPSMDPGLERSGAGNLRFHGQPARARNPDLAARCAPVRVPGPRTLVLGPAKFIVRTHGSRLSFTGSGHRAAHARRPSTRRLVEAPARRRRLHAPRAPTIRPVTSAGAPATPPAASR